MKQYTVVVKPDEVSKKIAEIIKKELEGVLAYNEKAPDLVISVGGDGTILQSVHQYMHQECSFVGVHTGTLGFFTDYQKEEIDQLILDIKKDKYKVITRNLLEVAIHQKDKINTFFALNEMRIDHGYTTQVIDVYIDDELLEVFRGNGLCVSTPSGSTAYNKSLGGAVIYPDNPLMQLSEVAGIQHNAYRSLGSSLILDAKHTITLVGRHFDKVYLGIDHLAYKLEGVEKIKIKIGGTAIKFVEYKEMSFVKRIKRAYIN